MQAWWEIFADDTAGGSHWTLELMVPTTAATLQCGGLFPSINYNHYNGPADAGAADQKFTTTLQPAMGSGCTITEATTAQVQGSHASGTFNGTVVEATDAGPLSHVFTVGSYDVIVP
jgi:hypothetical protein